MKEEINKIALEVQGEFQMGGLAEGLYLDFATEVAKRYASLAVSKERERILEVVEKIPKYFSDDSGMEISIIGEWIREEELINIINTK